MKLILLNKLRPYANYIAGIVLFIFLIAAFLVTKFFFYDEWCEPSVVELKPKINCTIVTAIFENRNLTSITGRHPNLNLLLMQVRSPMIVFTNGNFNDAILDNRKLVSMENQTKIWSMAFESLPLYANYTLFDQILTEEQLLDGWKEEWDLEVKERPELQSAQLSILSNSKSYFLLRASKDNPFNTSFFAWFDPDFGSGKPEIFPNDVDWTPTFPENKISILKLTPLNDSLNWYDREKLYHRSAAVINTEFIGADSSAIEPFHRIYQEKLLKDAVSSRAVDEPQTALVGLIQENKHLFNVIQAEWFNVFELF